MKPGDILLIALPIIFVLFLVRSQRKRTQQAASLQEQIQPGASICTSSGLFGTVISLTDTEFVLEAAPGVHLRFDRRAIGLVVPSNQAPNTLGTPDDPAEPDGHPDSA
jgi:preprotein translocase subunit YajC